MKINCKSCGSMVTPVIMGGLAICPRCEGLIARQDVWDAVDDPNWPIHIMEE